jgi:hypothetical protein
MDTNLALYSGIEIVEKKRLERNSYESPAVNRYKKADEVYAYDQSIACYSIDRKFK